MRDDDGTIVDFLATYANAALERISGMRIDEIVDHRLLDFVPAFREGGPFDAYRNVVETGEPWEQEVSSTASSAASASPAVFEMRAVKLGDGILVTYRDMTALRRAEAAAELMAAIVESTDDAIVGAGRDGRVTHWNPGATRLLGYAREEIVGETCASSCATRTSTSQNERFARVLAGERVERIETQWVRKDGSLLDVVLTASPLRDRAGEVIGASAVVHDITARKRDEAELRRSHAELERFADIAAHDLREPLMAITSSPRCSSAASSPSARRSSPTCARRPTTARGSSTGCSTSRASAAAPPPARARRPAPGGRGPARHARAADRGGRRAGRRRAAAGRARRRGRARARVPEPAGQRAEVPRRRRRRSSRSAPRAARASGPSRWPTTAPA